jgi:hypothetical protein
MKKANRGTRKYMLEYQGGKTVNGIARTLFVMVFMGFMAAACSTTSGEIITKSQCTRTDVFAEMDQKEASTDQGFAELVVRSSIKTHSGDHPLWWVKDAHGGPGYRVVFNVDGQAITWEIAPQDDVIRKSFEERADDPEAGSGVRYVVEKRLRFRSGEKTVFLGLPEETCCTSVKIRIEEGRENVLEFRPIYRRSGTRNIRNFTYGVERLEVFFNGNRIE